ncbi:MAG: hypothetical protein RLZZ589_719 [Cyanobacteriota bacterium]
MADAQRFPQLHVRAEGLAQLAAALHRFITMQLHHPMAAVGHQIRQLGLLGVRHHQHPQAGGVGRRQRRKQRRTQLGLQVARRGGHGDHANGIGPQAGHRHRLLGLAQAAHLQPGPGRGRLRRLRRHGGRPDGTNLSRIVALGAGAWEKAGSC